MCGIAGIASKKTDSINLAELLLEMSKVLTHRGPDDEGFFLSGNSGQNFFSGQDTPENVSRSNLSYTSREKLSPIHNNYQLGLCHRRLSILDLSPRGHQPMCNENEDLIITYNGEIYNYIELREELKSKGYRFYSETDTEVILNAYKEWGSECLNRFNGMWSFVIFEKKKNELFCARDRFGVKPFYYYHDQDFFCFASEQKALVRMPFVKTYLNDKAVYDFLAKHEMEYEPQGFFGNILELFPGNFLRVNLNQFTFSLNTYYSLSFNTNFSRFDDTLFEEAKSKTEKLLEDAVNLRLRSDVPVGSCLSGGIDSSVIAGIMQRVHSPDFFTATFPGTTVDESEWAAEVIKQGGEWHKVSPTSEELWRDLDELIYSQDVPIWSSSTYSQFRVMKLAKDRNVKVLLDGQGGDELFAGYVPYFLSYWDELKNNGQHQQLKSEMNLFNVSGSASTFIFKEKVKNKINLSGNILAKKLISPELKFFKKDFFRHHAEISKVSRQPKTLNSQLSSEFCNSRLKLYLKCEDRCSMWHSVESRTPFADDIHLIEYVFSLPGTFKIHNGQLKYLLRQATKKYLPQKIFNRKDKMGYVTPHNVWIKELHAQILEEDFGSLSDFIDVDRLNKSLKELYSPDHLHERFFGFKILALLRWKRLFSL